MTEKAEVQEECRNFLIFRSNLGKMAWAQGGNLKAKGKNDIISG